MGTLLPLPSADDPRLAQIDAINSRWSPRYFERPRLPLEIGRVEERELFARRGDFNIQDMPIKMSGSTAYRVPAELEQFSEVVDCIARFEATHNPRTSEFYAFITVKQTHVEVGRTQRREGAHADGFPVDLDALAPMMDHTYVVYDSVPTEFFDQPFPIGGAETYRDALRIFDSLADERKIVTVPPYVVALMDACTVHRSAKARTPLVRTFVKVAYSLSRFNRLGNTKNKLFDYNWEMHPRGDGRTPSSTEG